MTIDFENESSTALDLDLYEYCAGCRILCDSIIWNAHMKAQVSILITDNDEIHRINLEQRGIDRPTDCTFLSRWLNMRRRVILDFLKKVARTVSSRTAES